MDQVHVIRQRIEREGKNQLDVAKKLGISRNTTIISFSMLTTKNIPNSFL